MVLGLIEVGLVVGLFFAGRFAVSSFRSSRSEGGLEGSFIFVPAPQKVYVQSSRLTASVDGHAYVCAEDPEHPGRYAVVIDPPVHEGDERAVAVIRHAILTTYGRDVSGISPNVSQRGEARCVEFELDGLTYVALAAPRGEFAAFTLRREE